MTTENEENENNAPVPMLNRFKNSTFFTENDYVKAEPEKYYSRSITRNPNSRQLLSFVPSFGPQRKRNLENSVSVKSQISMDTPG